MENNFTQDEKYAIVRILALIMEADLFVHPNEVEYINSIMARFNIIDGDAERMELMDMELCVAILKGMDVQKQSIAKDMFIKMSSIDGYVDSREETVINNLFSIK